MTWSANAFSSTENFVRFFRQKMQTLNQNCCHRVNIIYQTDTYRIHLILFCVQNICNTCILLKGSDIDIGNKMATLNEMFQWLTFSYHK